MATLPDINTKISNLTTTDTTQYPNADRLIDINLWYQKIVGMILDAQDETDYDDPRKADYPIITTPVTTNRDYSFPVSLDLLKFKTVSVSYDGVNFYKATPLDDAETSIPNSTGGDATQNATIDANYSRNAPRYDIKYGSLWLYPMAKSADVSAGGLIILEYSRGTMEFTLANLSDTLVIPGFDSTFHMMLAYGAAYEYCESKGMPQAERLYRELQVYEDRLRKQYSSKQLDRHYSFQSEYQSYK